MPSDYFEGAFYLWCKSASKDPTSLNLQSGVEGTLLLQLLYDLCLCVTCKVCVLELNLGGYANF